MAIITISRGSCTRGKEIAEMVAKNLGYKCISREVLLEASDRYGIEEIRLERAIHDAPSILERRGLRKAGYISYIRSALTARVRSDNIVYHGLAGHLLLRGIPHVLKVRILADIEVRAALEAEREGISIEKARAMIEQDDEERRKWAQSLYGVDPWDSHLYDLVLKVDRLTLQDVVDIICDAAKREGFRTTPASQQMMTDLAIACAVKAELIEEFPEAMVACNYGNVVVYSGSGERKSKRIRKIAAEIEHSIEGINSIEVHPDRSPPNNAV
jgi:cytidylate kinase